MTNKKALLLSLLLGISFTLLSQTKKNPASAASAAGAYFPPPGEWQHRSPASLGLDSTQLQAAIKVARDNEAKAPRDLELASAESFGKGEPFDEGEGPFTTRGEPTGLIIYKGFIVAEWGEPLKVDMTHSVTKSFFVDGGRSRRRPGIGP